MFHDLRSLPRIFFVENGISNPACNLIKVNYFLIQLFWNQSSLHTRLLVWMTVVILSTCSVFCSRERWRHSIGFIFWYSRLSMMVNCLASSKGSTSRSFNFLFVFGIIGAGGGPKLVFTKVFTQSPPRCYGDVRWACDCSEVEVKTNCSFNGVH